MRIPWLVVGTLIGILGGLFFMPSPDPSKTMAEQNIPPIAGACLGAFLGAIAEVAVRRIDTCSPIRLPSLLHRQRVIGDTTFGTKTMLVAVALAAIACAYPDWFVSIAFCTIIFSLYFAACTQSARIAADPVELGRECTMRADPQAYVRMAAVLVLWAGLWAFLLLRRSARLNLQKTFVIFSGFIVIAFLAAPDGQEFLERTAPWLTGVRLLACIIGVALLIVWVADRRL